MINRGGPSFVVRIDDQTGASPAAHRRRLRRGARQLRHDRAQHRDRRARQQDPRQAAARSLRGGAGSAARPRWSGSCAMSIWRKGLAAIVEHYRDGIAAVAAALDGALPPEAASARGARASRADQSRRAGSAGAPARRSAGAGRRARHRLVADRAKQHIADVAATYFAAEAFFRLDRIAQRRARHQGRRTISTGWRSTARSIRSAMPNAASPPPWPATARPAPHAVEAWVAAAPGRRRTHPLLGARDRQLRHDAVEAFGGGEPAGRSGEAVIAVPRATRGPSSQARAMPVNA